MTDNPSTAEPSRTSAAPRGMGIFSLIWLGQVVSTLGTFMLSFGIGVSLFQETGSVMRYTMIGVAMAGPMVAFLPLAGVLADRVNRRLLLLFGNMGSACGTLLLYALLEWRSVEAYHLYAVVALKGAFEAFIWPTLYASIAQLVDKDQYGRASGLIHTSEAVGHITGPLLGGFLLVAFGLRTLVLIDVATFLWSATILLLVRFPELPQSATEPPSEEARTDEAPPEKPASLRDGWDFIRARPGLFRLLFMFLGLSLCLGFLEVLTVPLVLGFATPVTAGIVLGLGSVGMLLGGVVMSVWGGPERGLRVRAILVLMTVQGLALFSGGLRPDATLITVAAFAFMACIPLINGSSQALWQSKVPLDLQGRVFGVRSLMSGAAVPIAMAIAGPVSEYLFEPLMAEDGALAASLGGLIGAGPGRGIGLFYIVLGILLLGSVLLAMRSSILRRVEEDVPDALDDAPRPDATGPDGAAALPRPGAVVTALVALALVALSALAILAGRPPEPRPADAPPDVFAAGRAARHLPALAPEPHVTGTLANRLVRATIEDELRAVGLEPEVQRAIDVLPGRISHLVRVENVLARIEATEGAIGGTTEGGSDDAILFVAHYDSAPTSPGASDNGAAVAALLEAARILVADPPRRNDVILLFTDAEEIGRNGARAFLHQHPWASDAAVVVNLDARGRGGPVYMFETGEESGYWIGEYLAAVEHPTTSSLLHEIYRRLPNETDFTLFRDAGVAGFNLAFIDGLTHYHTALDRPEAVSRRSLQEQGEIVLGLARHLGALDLEEAAAQAAETGPRTWFSLPGGLTPRYPRPVAWGLDLLAAGLLLALLAGGFRRGWLTPMTLAQGVLAFLGVAVTLGAGVTLAWLVVRDVFDLAVIMGSTPAAGLWMGALASFGIVLALFTLRFFRRVIPAFPIAVGAQLWCALLVVAMAVLEMPVEAHYVLVWPLLGATAGGLLWLRAGGGEGRGRMSALALVAAALPAIAILVPLAVTLYVALQSLFQLGGAPLLPLVLLLGLLLPQVEVVSRRFPRATPAAPALAALLLAGVALAVEPPGHEARSVSSVVYTYDADADARRYFTFDLAPTPWTEQFGFKIGEGGPIDDFVPLGLPPLMSVPAPEVDLPTPRLEILGATAGAGNTRDLELRLEAAEGAVSRLMWLDPADAALDLRTGGAVLSLAAARSGENALIQEVPPPSSETYRLRLRGDAPVTLYVLERLPELPLPEGVPPRPAESLARPLFFTVTSDAALVRRGFVLDPEIADAAAPNGTEEGDP